MVASPSFASVFFLIFICAEQGSTPDTCMCDSPDPCAGSITTGTKGAENDGCGCTGIVKKNKIINNLLNQVLSPW